jgi:hypothetical protein
LARADQAVAGFADALTFSLTTKAREGVYGHTAAKNHQGAVFVGGQVVGTATSVAIGLGGPMQAAQGAKLAKAGQGLAKVGKQALRQGTIYGNRARVAGQMGLPRTTLQLMRRSITRRETAERLLRDGFRKALRAGELNRSARVAQVATDVEFALGTINLILKAGGYDPCDPLSLWDALYLLPAIQQARRLRKRFGPQLPKPQPPSPYDKKAQELGYDNVEEFDRANMDRFLEMKRVKDYEASREAAVEYNELIELARRGGVEDHGKIVRLTDEGAEFLRQEVKNVLRGKDPIQLTLDYDAIDSIRDTAEASPRFGSVVDAFARQRARISNQALPAFGPAAQASQNINEAPTVFFK